jgi:peroxiredoxin
MNRRQFLAAAAVTSALRGATIPRPAILKSYPGPAGQTVDLAAYKGKVLAVEFLLTTCPACQKCARAVEKMYGEFGARGFQAVGLAVNVTKQNASTLLPTFARQFGVTFPLGFATEPEYREFLEMSVMTRPMFPQLAFVDKKGMIRAQHVGSDAFFYDEEKNMREMITKLLAESTAAPRKK